MSAIQTQVILVNPAIDYCYEDVRLAQLTHLEPKTFWDHYWKDYASVYSLHNLFRILRRRPELATESAYLRTFLACWANGRFVQGSPQYGLRGFSTFMARLLDICSWFVGRGFRWMPGNRVEEKAPVFSKG